MATRRIMTSSATSLFRHVGPSAGYASAVRSETVSEAWLFRSLSTDGNEGGGGDDCFPLHAGNKDQLYLHVAPCGDWWTDREIFAAKHLQPDYVRSIPIPDNFDAEKAFGNGAKGDGERVGELLRRAYDEGVLPEVVLVRFCAEGQAADGQEEE